MKKKKKKKKKKKEERNKQQQQQQKLRFSQPDPVCLFVAEKQTRLYFLAKFK